MGMHLLLGSSQATPYQPGDRLVRAQLAYARIINGLNNSVISFPVKVRRKHPDLNPGFTPSEKTSDLIASEKETRS